MFDVHLTVQRDKFLIIKPTRCTNFSNAAAMTSASDEKWRPFDCFFHSGRAKDLSAPMYCASVSGRQSKTPSHFFLIQAKISNFPV